MKDFFSEYGWTIVIVCFVLFGIAMVTPVGEVIKTAFIDLVAKVMSKFTGML